MRSEGPGITAEKSKLVTLEGEGVGEKEEGENMNRL